MPRNKDYSTSSSKDSSAKEMSVKDMTTTFLAVLDNDDVITKLAMLLSASINLTLDEKMVPILSKLDEIVKDNKTLQKRISNVEQENEKLKQQNDGLQLSLVSLTTKVNLLEQTGRRNNIVITGIPETYAERTEEAIFGDDGEIDASSTPHPSREDTIKAVCSVLHEACNIEIKPADISSAFRLRSKRTGPRPILVSFHSMGLRSSVVRARRPKQQLRFKGSNIFINDHLTKLNSDLAYRARQYVKQREAHSTWVRDGQIFVKWSTNSNPTVIHAMADFD